MRVFESGRAVVVPRGGATHVARVRAPASGVQVWIASRDIGSTDGDEWLKEFVRLTTEPRTIRRRSAIAVQSRSRRIPTRSREALGCFVHGRALAPPRSFRPRPPIEPLMAVMLDGRRQGKPTTDDGKIERVMPCGGRSNVGSLSSSRARCVQPRRWKRITATTTSLYRCSGTAGSITRLRTLNCGGPRHKSEPARCHQ